MKPIIEIKGIGKKYRIDHQRGKYVALRDVLASIAKRPFAFLKQRAKRAAGFQAKEEFWALRDINLEIQKGEIVGIIGANGAGKSTLLKILTGITPPTEGEIVMRGRVASLLEVGTGFHPELTGRENIFLNGAILGMTRKEIAQKFDEIVAFAGIDKFLDTPVKHYSSGMYVRLAFSVAAHMEPDILLVDEVLAVGDAEFQKKCLGKMEEVTQKDGRTILFVSHNMGAIQALCPRSVLIHKGKIIKEGPTTEVISAYTQGKNLDEKEGGARFTRIKPFTRSATITSIHVTNEKGEEASWSEIGHDVVAHIEYEVAETLIDAVIGILVSHEGIPLLYSYDTDVNPSFSTKEIGRYVASIPLPFSSFKEGRYSITLFIGHGKENLTDPEASIEISIINNTLDLSHKSYRTDRPGILMRDLPWKIHPLS